MSDDSQIEDNRRKRNMSSKRSKGKGKRSTSVGNEKGAKRRRLEPVGKRETSTDKTNTRAKPYDCQLCETAFNNVSSRNGHYSGKHKVQDEKLLFFPNGTGLVESSLEHQISLKPDWFKAAVRSKRRSTVCKLCVVDLDTDGHLNLHYKDIHKVTRMSVLSELIRLKTTDIKKVAVTHKCDTCTASFDDAQELESHMKSAHDADFKRCDYCNIRVQIDVYNAHIQKKHADMIDKRVESVSVVEDPEPKRKQAKREKKVKAVKKVETPKREVNKDKVKKTKDQKVADWCSKLVPAAKKTALTLYLCKACKKVTASYDNAVSHAQDHILNLPTATNHCGICKLNFAADFDMHRKMHLTNDDLDADSFKLFPYDYRLLMSHKWFDMFVNTSKAMANKVRSASIYFPSRCIRLKLENESKDPSERFTLFMCVTCNKYVDPPSIELHVEQQGDCSNQLSCYLCYRCKRQFFSQKARDQHSLTHEIPDASKKYRKVLFNDRHDLICNKKLLQAGMNIVVTNNEGVNNNPTENVESVIESDIITVVNEALYKGNNIEMIEKDILNELYPTVTDNDVVADIYECKCGLSFDRLEFLCKHWKICSPALKLVTKTCKCGLIFDKQNYDYHCTVHSNGITTFSVNEVSIRVKSSINVRHIIDEFINTTEMNNTEIVYDAMEEDNVIRDEDVNKINQGRSLRSLQVVNIENMNEVAANNLLNERQTLSNPVHQPVNIENYQQSSNEHCRAEYIVKTQDDPQTVYEELETYKVLISNAELQNQVTMDVTDASISNQNDEVLDNEQNSNKNAGENKSVVDTSMGINLQQGIHQSKNLLISNSEEQDSAENTEPEKEPVSPPSHVTYQDKNVLSDTKDQDSVENFQTQNTPVSSSLEENELSDSVMKENPNENVIHNTDSLIEVRDIAENNPSSNTELNEESYTRDEALIKTQGVKRNIELIDNQNKNTENYQQTHNEPYNSECIVKMQACSQTVEKEFEAHKVLIFNEISNDVQTELEHQVAMDITDVSINIKINDVPDYGNVCNNNTDENQSMVDTSMETESEQVKYQDQNFLISKAKEQDSFENCKPESDPVSASLEENDLSDSVLKEIPHENMLHSSNSVNETSNIVENKLDYTEITKESETHDGAVINTQGANTDVQIIDKQNKNTEHYQQTSIEHDSAEYIGETQANNETVDKELEANKVLFSSDIGKNVSELDHQIAKGITDTSISIQNYEVRDSKNLCNNNVDENQSMVNLSMETDLQHGIYQDKDILISNTKEQDSVENSEPQKGPVSSSLEENELSESPHNNVVRNTNLVGEIIYIKSISKTEITEESSAHDEPMINTQGIKAEVEFVANQNENTGINQQNSNEHDNDVNKSMVNLSKETELQHGIYQDRDILISNTKEQDSVENSEPQKGPVSSSLEENELSESPHNNIVRNTNLVGEIINIESISKTEITEESSAHDEPVINTQGIKAEIEFVANQNKNTGIYQQNSNEHDNAEFISKPQAFSQTIDKFEADNVLFTNDIGKNVSQSELEHQVTMDVTGPSINIQNDNIPDNGNVCNDNAAKNQSMVDTAMEIDIQQVTYQDKYLLSDTKEQDSVENIQPQNTPVSPSLEENELSDRVIKESPHENVVRSSNSADEISTIESISNTEESNTHDGPVIITRGAKVDVEFVGNENMNTGIYQQTSNDYSKFISETQACSQTIDKFEADKSEIEHQVRMDVTGPSINIQNDNIKDNENVCNDNADKKQSMVDNSMEIDIQQMTYQDKNLLRKTKEQDSVENFQTQRTPVSPVLEENELSDSVMKEIPHENIIHNKNSINEVSNIVDDKPCVTEITEKINTHYEPVNNTLGAKPDIKFVDNQNKNTVNYQETRDEHDSAECIGKAQACSQTIDEEFEPHKVLMLNDISNNVFQTELENQVDMDITDASVSIKSDDIPDSKNECNENVDKTHIIIDTSMEMDIEQVTYQDKNLLISNTKEQDSVENSQEQDPVSPSLEENQLSDRVIKEIPHKNVLHNATNVNRITDFVEDKPNITEIAKESNTHDEITINTQELWAKEADVAFVDSQNKDTERIDIVINHPKYEENERELVRTEFKREYYINQAAEIVYSEEELLDGPEDPDVVEDSLLTDDEDL